MLPPVAVLVPVFALILAATPALAVPDAETCVAYMEADAEAENTRVVAVAKYQAARKKALDAYAEAEQRAATQFSLSASQPYHVVKMNRRSYNDALHRAEAARDTALHEAMLRRDMAVSKAETVRAEAYRAAYDGPHSEMASVMAKLIAGSRFRCRRLYEAWGQ